MSDVKAKLKIITDKIEQEKQNLNDAYDKAEREGILIPIVAKPIRERISSLQNDYNEITLGAGPIGLGE